jgi:hypothetical protein
MVMGKLPLSFIPNVGQFDPQIRFMAQNVGGTWYFLPGEVMVIPAFAGFTSGTGRYGSVEAVRMMFQGSNSEVQIKGEEKLAGTANYFIGNNPEGWHRNISTYNRLIYDNLYPGITLQYQGQNNKLKSTYLIAPYANPKLISWRYSGASKIQVEVGSGDLLIQVNDDDAGDVYTLREQSPTAWQIINHKQVIVDVGYNVSEGGTIQFLVGTYDPAYPLTIDPLVLAYSTYLGGTGVEWGEAIVADNNGNIYVSGATNSGDFPMRNAYDDSLALCGVDAFIAKIDTTQSAENSLVYSTYLGGSGNCANDNGVAIAIDSTGNAYITGFVQANDFPVVNGFDTTKGNGEFGPDTSNDVFVAKLNPAGNELLYSTYLGGAGGVDDLGYGIVADEMGRIYLCGSTNSEDFPVKNAYQPSKKSNGVGLNDAFVSVLDTTQSGENSLVYSSYLGGTGVDTATGIVTDNTGRVYVSGRTNSTDFPIKNGYQTGYGGGVSDIFVTGIDTGQSGESALVYSTYLGGNAGEGDDVYSNLGGIALDGYGKIYVTGETQSSNFPAKGAYQAGKSGSTDAFVAKLDPTQGGVNSLPYSTYLGGNGDDVGHQITVTNTGNAFVIGSTVSSDFPTKAAYQSSRKGGNDIFVTKVATTGASLVYSTYFGGSGDDIAGGIAIDSAENVYVTGATASTDFPVHNAYDSGVDSGDGFVAKLALSDTETIIYLPVIFKDNSLSGNVK